MDTPPRARFPLPLHGWQRRAVLAFEMAALAILAGCMAYDAPPGPPVAYAQPASVYSQPMPVTSASVEYASGDFAVSIASAADFYAPLAPYGDWVVIGNYGRCWRPRNVDRNWRPYTDGHWEWTDDGWYWVSDEPWGWATCHYGRWDEDDEGRWFWVPRTEWAPAWVEWREGDGYVGWAPEGPRGRGQREDRGRRFVFVPENRMSEAIRPNTVIVNNTTIINRTVNITNVRTVNRTVISAGPRRETIEQHSGRRFTPVPVRQVRAREEEKVPARLRPAAAHPAAAPAMRMPANERPATNVRQAPAAPARHQAPAATVPPRAPAEKRPLPRRVEPTHAPAVVTTPRQETRPAPPPAPVPERRERVPMRQPAPIAPAPVQPSEGPRHVTPTPAPRANEKAPQAQPQHAPAKKPVPKRESGEGEKKREEKAPDERAQ